MLFTFHFIYQQKYKYNIFWNKIKIIINEINIIHLFYFTLL